MKLVLSTGIVSTMLLSSVAMCQSSGLALDAVVSNTGQGGGVIVPSLHPSQPNELAFLIVTNYSPSVFNSPPCPAGASVSQELTAISPPWLSKSFNNVLDPIGILPGKVLYPDGYSLTGTYPFTLQLTGTAPIGATLSGVFPSCMPDDWSAVLALVKHQTSYTASGFSLRNYLSWSSPDNSFGGTYTIAGPATSSPQFLIGYIAFGSLLKVTNSITPTLSDPYGNPYQVIANLDTVSTNESPWSVASGPVGTHSIVFISQNYVNPTGQVTVSIPIASSYYLNPVFVGGVLLSPGVPAPSIVDPITDDPSVNLMAGPFVTSSPASLVNGGSPVQGIAADGVSEIVIKVPTASVGDNVTLTLTNDQNGASTNAAYDGGLGLVGDTVAAQSQITLSSVDTGQGPYAFAVYRSPIDFVRQYGSSAGSCGSSNNTDDQLACRYVTVNIQNTTQQTNTSLLITILRPPLVLVHGLWDKGSSWNNFTPLTGNPLFSTLAANYNLPIGSDVAATYPAISDLFSNMSHLGANSLGFSYNAPIVSGEISQFIHVFKNGQNPLAINVASVQADVVAHSMGGMVVRQMALQPEYLSDNTFGKGVVHKMITIDTPHLGSQVSANLLADQQGGHYCLTNILAASHKYVLSGVLFYDGSVVTGATADLNGDDVTGQYSQAINQLRVPPLSASQPIPISMIGGNYTNFEALDSSATSSELRRLCKTEPLAQQLTSTGWLTVFHGNANDAIVSENSQFNGNAPNSGRLFNDYVHSSGTEALGFTGPGMLDSGAVPSEVIYLLNTPLNDANSYTLTVP